MKHSKHEKDRRSVDHHSSEKDMKVVHSGESFHNLKRNNNNNNNDHDRNSNNYDNDDNNDVKVDDDTDDDNNLEYDRNDCIDRTHHDKKVKVMNNIDQLSRKQLMIDNKSHVHVCDTYETTLQELKSNYPTLIFQVIDDNTISINIQGYWLNILVIDNIDGQFDNHDDHKDKDSDSHHQDRIIRVDRNTMKFVDNYVIFKETEASLLEKDETWRGAYLVVNNADDKYLHESEDSALREKEGKHSFVGRIGYNERETATVDSGPSVDDNIYIKGKKITNKKTSSTTVTRELYQDSGDTVANHSSGDNSSENDGDNLLHPLFEKFKTAKYERLNIKSDEESIFVDIQGHLFNVISKDDKNNFDEDAMKFVDNYVIFKETEASLLEKDETWRGAYLVVNNVDEKYLYETEDSALRGKEGKNSFVGRIGYIAKTAEVLALRSHEKPANFENLNVR